MALLLVLSPFLVFLVIANQDISNDEISSCYPCDEKKHWNEEIVFHSLLR